MVEQIKTTPSIVRIISLIAVRIQWAIEPVIGTKIRRQSRLDLNNVVLLVHELPAIALCYR